MTFPAHRKQLQVEGDNYKQTVLALRAFANEILFDDNSRTVLQSGSVHCGRKMTTSEANRRSKNTDVHPDLVICQSKTYGVIAEAKFGFDTDPQILSRLIDETVEQLEKYDDDLEGWPGQKTISHDLVLLINHEDARRVARELKTRQGSGNFQMVRKFAIISIVRSERATGVWPVLDLETGDLSDANKTTKLQDRLPIRPDLLARNPHVGLVELYDEAPPLPVLMDLIHKAIASNLTPDEYEQYNVEGHVDKTVDMRQLRSWLSEYAFKKSDGRDPAIPKPDWIPKAIVAFVKMGWAERKPSGKESFIYHHKKGRKNYNDPYGRFVEFCAKKLAEADERARRKSEREKSKSAKRRETDKKKLPLLADQIDKEGTLGYKGN